MFYVRQTLLSPELHQEAYEWAKKISEHLLPKTRAYAEIWLDGEKLATTDEEPILGSNYLPRKVQDDGCNSSAKWRRRSC